MKSKPTIAVYTSAEGHLSIAQSIVHTLESRYQVQLFVHREKWLDFYRPIYQFFPGFFQVPFSIAQYEQTWKTLFALFRRQTKKPLTHFMDLHQPALNINTYFTFNPILEDAAHHKHIPLLNVLTDPRTVHPLIVSGGADQNLAFDQQQISSIQEYNLSANYLPVGWFVRPEFEQPYQQAQVRRQLKLRPDALTLLVTAGSEGTTLILKVLPSLFMTDRPLQVIVACGSNHTLYRATTGLKKILHLTNPQHNLVVLKFTHHMAAYMQASDLVIGKAGPNSLFESVATLTPFFAITHISGQEDGNLDLIREHKLGYVEENPFKAQKLLKRIIDRPHQLKHFSPHLQKMATYNQDAKKKLLTLVQEYVGA